jgi:RecB family exonuclease
MSAAPLPLKSGFTKHSTEVLIEARERLNEVLDLRARQWSLFEDKATANTAVQICTEYPAVLSPSSLNCFLDCQAKWFYRKVLGLPEKRTLALGVGSAVHEALGENFRSKMHTGEDMPIAEVQTVFRDEFERQLDSVTLNEDDDIADAKHCGDVMLGVYMDQAAPAIRPAAVEHPVSGLIGNVPVHGFIDLLDVDGNVVDLKTAAKKPSGFPVAHRRQVATYVMLEPKANGRARLDTLTKTKTVALHSQTIDITPDDRRHTERLYSIALEQMRSGLVVPNRSSFLCSRKHCSYWEQCIADYGGVVD